MSAVTPADVRSALRGDKRAMRTLLEEIAPVVQARAVRVMGRLHSRMRASGHEHSDLVQESFVRLFAHGGKVLLQWSPERGMSLRNWVGLIVERALAKLLHCTSSSLELANEVDLYEVTRDDPIAALESRSELACLAERLGHALPAHRLALFAQLCVQREQISDVARDTGISEKALYAARTRMERLVRGLASGVA